MEFLNLNFLWNLIWVLPLLFILFILASQKRRKLLNSVLGKKYSVSEFVNLSHGKRSFKTWLLIGIAFFLVIAASRPYWGYRILPFTGSGKDILAVVDVSKSMLSKDIPPSRLEHAKLLLKNLIKNTPGDRYGIIAFAGSAFLECPLTIDRTSLFSILKDINTESIPVGGTNIEKALKTAIKAFKAAAGGYKAIILITDGDELHGRSENVLERLKELKTPLLVVGIGDPSKPGLIQLPAKNGQSRFLKDSKGDLVKSKLNETQLKKLAEATNGVYIRSTAVDPGLNILEKKIAQLIPEKYENGKMTRPLEKFQLPLLIVVILMFTWLCIGEIKKPNKKISKTGKAVSILLFTTFFILSFNITSLRADEQIAESDNIEPQQPLQISKESTQTTKNPPTENANLNEDQKTPLEVFNMGVTAHEKGDISTAKKHYTNAINSAENNKDIRSKAYQNMGVLQHAAARNIIMQNPEESLKILDKAENLYKEAMRRDTLRHDIAANQQILINDRKKAKDIIKRRKEMEKKRNEARQKTQEALKKQQQANKEKKKQQNQEKKQNTQNNQKNTNQQQKDQQDQQSKQQQKKKDNQKDQSKKDSQQQKKDQQTKDEQKQDSNSEQQQGKGEQKQDNYSEQQQAKSDQLQREANRKTQEAQKAMQDYKQSAKENNSQQDMQAAESASNDITNARKNQRSDNTENAEKDLQEALKKLGQPQQQNNQKNQQKQNKNKQEQNQQKKAKSQDTQQKKNQAEQKTEEALKQQQQANQSQGQDKKEKQEAAKQKTQEAQKAMDDYKNSAEKNNNPKDKEKAEKAKQNLQNAEQNQNNNDGKQAEEQLKQALENIKGKKDNKQQNMPDQPKAQRAKQQEDNKDIDPKQAEALLKLMANEEKSLKDELKKRQKQAYGNMHIDKDW